MRRITLTCGVTLLAIFLVNSTSAAQTSQPAPAGAGAGAGGPGERRGGMMLERVRDMLGDLQLSDDQKAKIDDVIKDAQQEMEVMRQEMRQLTPQERGQRINEFLTNVRGQINEQLNPEQRAKFQEKMDQLRGRFRDAFAGGAGAGGGAGATTRPEGAGAMLLSRLQDALGKLDLSDDQKQKVSTIVEDARGKMKAIRAKVEAGATMADVRDEARQVLMDLRQKLSAVLTEPQRAKFRQEMEGIFRDFQNGRGAGGGGGANSGEARPRGARGGASTSAPAHGDLNAPEEKKGAGAKMDEDKTADSPRAEMNTAAKPAPAGRSPAQSAGLSESATTGGATTQDTTTRGTIPPAPDVGAAAPSFTLDKLDGRPVQLASYKGRVLVLVFGSYSSPSFRQRMAGLHQLSLEVGNRAQFLVVYTKEAHPSDGWQVDRNRDDHVEVAQHQTIADRKAATKTARDKLHITFPIAIDGLDDATAAAYGAGESSAVVIGRDGTIVAEQRWADPSGLRRIIDDAAAVATAKQ